MAENENLVVYGLYPDRLTLEEGVMELRDNGFRAADISVLFPSEETNREFAHEHHTKIPEGAGYGATTGAAIGGTLGWLAGIGAIAIPGIGPFVAAGPVAGMLAGMGAGSVTGGLVGALIGIGIPEYEAKRYEGRIKEGGILCSVHCDNDDWQDKAADILRRTGAQDVSETGEASSDQDTEERPRRRHDEFSTRR